jgi:hypothetical protein
MIYRKTKERIISKEQAAIISVEESTKYGAPAQNQTDRSNLSTAEYQHLAETKIILGWLHNTRTSLWLFLRTSSLPGPVISTRCWWQMDSPIALIYRP